MQIEENKGFYIATMAIMYHSEGQIESRLKVKEGLLKSACEDNRF